MFPVYLSHTSADVPLIPNWPLGLHAACRFASLRDALKKFLLVFDRPNTLIPYDTFRPPDFPYLGCVHSYNWTVDSRYGRNGLFGSRAVADRYDDFTDDFDGDPDLWTNDPSIELYADSLDRSSAQQQLHSGLWGRLIHATHLTIELDSLELFRAV